jgi:hypothetical protein
MIRFLLLRHGSAVRMKRKATTPLDCRNNQDRFELPCEAGFQAYVFQEGLESFRFRRLLNLHGCGKCGITDRQFGCGGAVAV